MNVDEGVLRLLDAERLRLARLEIERAALALTHAAEHLDAVKNVADRVMAEVHAGPFNGWPFPSVLNDTAHALGVIKDAIQRAENHT